MKMARPAPRPAKPAPTSGTQHRDIARIVVREPSEEDIVERTFRKSAGLDDLERLLDVPIAKQGGGAK